MHLSTAISAGYRRSFPPWENSLENPIAILVPTWFVCKKAGFSPWLSLIVLLFPFGGLILLYVLAFAGWKVTPVGQPQWPPYHGYPPQPPAPPQPPVPPQF